MDRFDDMDKAFGLGTIFGIGITTVTVGVSMCVRIAKSKNRIKKAVARLFQEIDESIKSGI